MSVKITSQIWDLRGIPATTKLIIVKLADNANDQGKCWPSVPSISKDCEVCERTVNAAINWAEKYGLISREMRSGKATIYHLTPAAYVPPQPMYPRRLRHRPPQITTSTPADYDITHIEPSKEEPSKEEPSKEEPSIAPNALAEKKTKVKPLTYMPANWRPNDAHRSKCATLGFDADTLAEEFTNHHLSKASKFADWDRAFFTWIGNAQKFGTKQAQRGNGQPPTSGIAAAGLRVAARYQGAV